MILKLFSDTTMREVAFLRSIIASMPRVLPDLPPSFKLHQIIESSLLDVLANFEDHDPSFVERRKQLTSWLLRQRIIANCPRDFRTAILALRTDIDSDEGADEQRVCKTYLSLSR
jgi:hypothetical protein